MMAVVIMVLFSLLRSAGNGRYYSRYGSGIGHCADIFVFIRYAHAD